jgi:hypothetical protein
MGEHIDGGEVYEVGDIRGQLGVLEGAAGVMMTHAD